MGFNTDLYFCVKIAFLKQLLLILIVLAGCQLQRQQSPSHQAADAARVKMLIDKGDSIYRRKSSYGDFVQSLELYDSALVIASALKDTLAVAESIFAKGRAYNAINRDPQKTIDYYKEAAAIYAVIPGKENDALYIKHLVAHAYDKTNDSTHCVEVLTDLYNEIIKKPDSIKRQLHFTAEMALISTVIRNFTLADSILTHLTKREWIRNDPIEYDYLNHYYLTKARLDIFNKPNSNSPYLDSLEIVFDNSRNFSDSAFFSNELLGLFRSTKNVPKIAYYEGVNSTLNKKLTSQNSIQEMQARLYEMEMASVENKRKQAALIIQTRTTVAYLLGILALLISVFAIFLVRKNREIFKKKNQLQEVHDKLYEKNLQNELLNKEIHHRVKNNLQMILSLVYMQERTTTTEEAKTNLQDIRLRIESVAALHEQLMERRDEPVDLKNYVTKMVNTVAGMVNNNQQIFTHLDIETLTIPVSKSFPLGQILNEWITNTLKHADAESESLVIDVSIKKENNCIVVRYNNSGSPIAANTIEPKLGLSIIDLLVIQLQGTLTHSDADFFAYSLTFNCDGE